jgi:hypothetical protein
MTEQRPVNVAIFEFKDNGKIQTCSGSAYTNKDDAIRDVWTELKIQGIKESQVTRIYSEWRLSAELEKLIEENFPHAPLTYSFEGDEQEEFEKAMNKLYNKSYDKKWWQFWK